MVQLHTLKLDEKITSKLTNMGCREKDPTGYKMYRTKHLITDLNEKENCKFSHMPCCLLSVQERIKTKKIKKPIYTFIYFKAVYTHIYLSVHNYAHFYTPIYTFLQLASICIFTRDGPDLNVGFHVSAKKKES